MFFSFILSSLTRLSQKFALDWRTWSTGTWNNFESSSADHMARQGTNWNYKMNQMNDPNAMVVDKDCK